MTTSMNSSKRQTVTVYVDVSEGSVKYHLSGFSPGLSMSFWLSGTVRWGERDYSYMTRKSTRRPVVDTDIISDALLALQSLRSLFYTQAIILIYHTAWWWYQRCRHVYERQHQQSIWRQWGLFVRKRRPEPRHCLPQEHSQGLTRPITKRTQTRHGKATEVLVKVKIFWHGTCSWQSVSRGPLSCQWKLAA